MFDPSLDKASWDEQVKQMQDESCEEYGYYQVTQGYRKVPGNICTNGVQLEPEVKYCRYAITKTLFSWTGLFMTCICIGVLYYGWPVIEAILILLPIPDPKVVKESTASLFNKILEGARGLMGSARPNKSEYL